MSDRPTVTGSGPTVYTRDGMDRAAAKLRQSAAQSGQTMTHTEARARIDAAVRRTPVTEGGR